MSLREKNSSAATEWARKKKEALEKAEQKRRERDALTQQHTFRPNIE